MSGIQLSDALIEDLKKTVQQHDAAAADDLVAVQYMAASVGYVIATLTDARFDKREVMKQLAEFSLQVFEQMQEDIKPKEEAFGVWKPGQ
ncbi:MAG: hypothetical protein OEY11_02960 [Gammaproteobacteria bacterium]|nr:hypothetical protein [Gammaproteobacteria bacterium]